MQQNTNEIFPRELTEQELFWLFAALPENKPGYKKYRELIDSLVVIGYGRFGAGNLVLGDQHDVVDLEDSSSPIFAIANITYPEANIYVTIHEEYDDQIEIDIKNLNADAIPEGLTNPKIWNYSDWTPGQKSPNDNGHVREVTLIKEKLVLAFAPTHKKIWVHNAGSGINHFVPVTNYYNEIMILLQNKNPEKALEPGRMFTDLEEFTDEQLITGFLIYNKRWKKVELDYNLFEHNEGSKKKSFLGIFKK